MATFTASAAQTQNTFFLNPPKYLEEGVIARTSQYTFTAAQSAGDVIQMLPVPKGASVVGLFTVWGLGGAAITANIGDTASSGRYYTSMSSNTALVQYANAGLGYSYSVDTVLTVTVGTATSASAAGTVRLTVLYQMDQCTDGTS